MKKAAEFLKQFKGKNVLLLGHKNADPDSVSSVIALSYGLKELGIKTRCGVIESASKVAQKILAELNESVEVDPELNVDLIILLDMSTEGQLSGFYKNVMQSNAQKMIIDHHAIHDYTMKADFSFIDEKATSTAGLVYDLLLELKVKITKEIAKIILLGIVAETAHLHYATIKDFQLISDLMSKFKLDYQWICAILETPLDVSERIARLKAAQRARFEQVGNFLIARSEISSFEASAARMLIRAGADVAIVAAKKEKEIRISTRATTSFYEKTKIDLGKDVIPGVAKIIGGTGSGHPTAAGANGRNPAKADEAMRYFFDFLKEKLAK